MKQKKRVVFVIIFALVFIAGLSLLLYPTISSWWNRNHQSHAIVQYNEVTSGLSQREKDELLEAARIYNDKLFRMYRGEDIDEKTLQEEYWSLLNVYGDGMMSVITIPRINVELPVRHGTDESVLQDGVGHLTNSSLPVGGANTHTVVSGHTGLPSARLFTDLEEVQLGDKFYFETLGKRITYEVDQILVVLPWQADSLAIEQNQDYCTLITCTPYGVNSHRLLVRGRRVDNEVDWKTEEEKLKDRNSQMSVVDKQENESSNLLKDEWLPVYIAFGAVIFLIIGLLVSRTIRFMASGHKRKRK